MLEKINDVLAGLPATIVGGVFLLASFILPRAGYPAGENLAWACVIICGLPLLYLALWRVVHNKGISKISSALLISIAMVAALLIGDLFAAGEVAFIMEIGALLEDKTCDRAKAGLKNLASLNPLTARIVRDGREESVPIEQVEVGDIVRVVPGEATPVDGIVVAGETSVDQSAMTGESLPLDKAPGDEVFSGTINRFGSVDVRASKVGQESSLQRLIRMVEDAQERQAPAQRIADKWASWLVPVALAIAVITYIVTGNIVRGVTVLVVFCPCALVLATPTAIMAAIGQATKHGVIIKSGEALEKMGKIRAAAFDKTGTLTQGRLEVSDVVSLCELREDDLLAIAAAAEVRSEHPLGKAIVAKATKASLELPGADEFSMSTGRGVSAVVCGRRHLLGNERFAQEHGASLSKDATEVLDRVRNEGKASVIVMREADATSGDQTGIEVAGVIALSDVIRPEAADVVSRMAAMGARPVLLTGDNINAARHLAEKVGIDEIHASLLPEEKVACVEELARSGGVCVVGDGINDAPALKVADVGIAMGAMGSDIAVESADVALMTDDVSRLPYLKWLSNATVRTITGAITLSMCINFVAVTLSVLGILNPTTGALVHNAGSCFVVLLAALLYDRKYPG